MANSIESGTGEEGLFCLFGLSGLSGALDPQCRKAGCRAEKELVPGNEFCF